MAKTLDDIRVLDFGRAVAGPFCTMLLKDLGAEVIKVEIPDGGDAPRNTPPLTQGLEGGLFINLNRGKKGITLNLASERGLQITKDLAKQVDVVVENFSPGVMDRLGLGCEELSKLNSGLIYASLSGYGHTGPRHSGLAYNIIVQAMGGLISVNGFPGDPPLRIPVAIGDYLAGFYTALAIVSALHHRSKTGEGQEIDISMQDAVWAITAMEHAPTYFLNNEIPQRTGNAFIGNAPDLIQPAKDGYVVIASHTVGQWESLLRAMGREDLIGVPKYSTQVERVKRRDEVNALVQEYTKTKRVDEIVDELTRVRVPSSPIPSFDQVANDPQLLSRDMIIEVEQAISGKVKVPGSVFKMSKTPGDVKFPAPFLGEHNYEVYYKMLGYSEQEVRKLADEGVI
ncbi:CaiB/BaiF CoA transferase family protein [Chloroflexota bacterium]